MCILPGPQEIPFSYVLGTSSQTVFLCYTQDGLLVKLCRLPLSHSSTLGMVKQLSSVVFGLPELIGLPALRINAWVDNICVTAQ